MSQNIISFPASEQYAQDIQACADIHGLTRSEVIRRCVYFGLVLVNSEQVALLKSDIGKLNSVDEVQKEKRLITQSIRDRADAVLFEVMED